MSEEQQQEAPPKRTRKAKAQRAIVPVGKAAKRKVTARKKSAVVVAASLPVGTNDLVIDHAHAREDVIRWCLGLMAEAKWSAGKSHGEGAIKFKATRAYIADCAGEASRILEREMNSHRFEVLPAILAGIEFIRQDALGHQYTWVSRGVQKSRPDPKHDVALRAYELYLKAMGLLTNKVEVSMSTDQQWEQVRQWLLTPSDALVKLLNECGWFKTVEVAGSAKG